MKYMFKKGEVLMKILLMLFVVSCQSDPIETTNKEDEKEKEPEPTTQEFQIIAHSDPRITTHSITTGNPGDQFVLGITNNGGGIINQMIVPGIAGNTDIMGNATDQYGRAGQVAIRDQSHSGRYNPTQAGHNEELGTKCIITEEPGKLIVEPRGMSLWHGDKGYDFTRWENLGDDAYADFTPDPRTNHKDPNYIDNKNSDEDGLDEEDLEGKMATEVHSEFDYYGTYEDWFGKEGITAATIRHYYQISYIRPPGHCINQFSEGRRVWNASKASNDISNNQPAGVHAGTDKDLGNMIGVWSIRNDAKIWKPTHVYYRTPSGQWKNRLAENAGNDFNSIGDSDDRIFINTNGNDVNNSRGIGLYRPNTDINFNSIIGINEKTGATVYKDNRFNSGILYTLARVATLTKFGFLSFGRGMINRTRLDPDVYEAYRNEVFILYGSPKQIMDSVEIIDNILK